MIQPFSNFRIAALLALLATLASPGGAFAGPHADHRPATRRAPRLHHDRPARGDLLSARPTTERNALLERARRLVEDAHPLEDPRDLLLAASTMLATRLKKATVASPEALHERIERFDGSWDLAGEEAHSEVLCAESKTSRTRAEEYLSQKLWADAQMAITASELLYRRAFRTEEIAVGAPRDLDLEHLARGVRELRRAGRTTPLLAGIEVELALAEICAAKGLGALAHQSAERARRLLELAAGATRDRATDRPRALEKEFTRFDRLLTQATPHASRSPRHRELHGRAVQHHSRAQRWVEAGQPRRAHREIVDGTRLLLRLIEESGAIDASSQLSRVEELLVVARERVAGLPSDSRASGLIARAESHRREAESAAAAGEPKRANESARAAEELLFEVLSLTRGR